MLGCSSHCLGEHPVAQANPESSEVCVMPLPINVTLGLTSLRFSSSPAKWEFPWWPDVIAVAHISIMIFVTHGILIFLPPLLFPLPCLFLAHAQGSGATEPWSTCSALILSPSITESSPPPPWFLENRVHVLPRKWTELSFHFLLFGMVSPCSNV